jgi:hypothetical protein
MDNERTWKRCISMSGDIKNQTTGTKHLVWQPVFDGVALGKISIKVTCKVNMASDNMTYKYFSDGEYHGELMDNRQHGYGAHKYNDETRYEGNWENGKRSGFGILYYEDSIHYEGFWKDDKKHDLEAKVYNSSGEIIQQGVFLHGEYKPNINPQKYKEDDKKKWSSIENSTDVNDFLRYRNDFKDFGSFLDLAKRKIDNIINEAWKKIEKSNNENDFQNFINKYSAVHWYSMEKAKRRIKEIQEYHQRDWNEYSRIKNSFDKVALNNYLKSHSQHGQYLKEVESRLKYVSDYLMKDSIRWDKISKSHSKKDFDEYIAEFSEGGRYIEMAKKKIAKIAKDFSRMFFELNYSFSTPMGMKAGGIHESHWGGYVKYQTTAPFHVSLSQKYPPSDDKFKFSIKNNLSTGIIYAPNNWLYLSFGGGVELYKDSLTQKKPQVGGELEAGLQFNAKGFSVSAGLNLCGMGFQKPYLDYNLGIGFNTYNYSKDYHNHLSLLVVNSLVSPVGIMLSGHSGNFGGYAKFQMPILDNTISKNYRPTEKYGIRYALSGGPVLNITEWMSLYGGLGIAFHQDSLKQKGAKVRMETEGGFMFLIAETVELTIGAHASKTRDNKMFYDYDFGIGFPTYVMDYIDDWQTIYQLSSSLTAQLGIMNEFIFDRGGFYVHFQTTIPSEKFIEKSSPNIKHGIRHSSLAGGVLAYTSFLSSYAGIGLGLYNDNFDNTTYKAGFEVETGVNISFPFFNLSTGLHWCRVGHERQFLDYNFGMGINFEDEYFVNDDWDIAYCFPVKYIFSPTAPIGLEVGFLWEYVGMYLKYQMYVPTKQDRRINASVGVIACPSALLHVYAGLGAGIYVSNVGFDIDGGVTINCFRVPVSIGIRACRVTSSERALSLDLGIGFYFE